MSDQATALALDVDFEHARAIHRVVRAFNDGECPRCHVLLEDRNMRHGGGGLKCPRCQFYVSDDDMQAAMQLFAPMMDRALLIFEAWREDRAAHVGASERVLFPPDECRIGEMVGRHRLALEGAVFFDATNSGCAGARLDTFTPPRVFELRGNSHAGYTRIL